MGYNPYIIRTPGVEHGPYDAGWDRASQETIAETGMSLAELEHEHQIHMHSNAVMRAWDESRITSEEADARLRAHSHWALPAEAIIE